MMLKAIICFLFGHARFAKHKHETFFYTFEGIFCDRCGDLLNYVIERNPMSADNDLKVKARSAFFKDRGHKFAADVTSQGIAHDENVYVAGYLSAADLIKRQQRQIEAYGVAMRMLGYDTDTLRQVENIIAEIKAME